MQRQKDGITKPQIVAGREFKGTSFISKPDKIIFKVTTAAQLTFIRTSQWVCRTHRLFS